MAEVLRTDAFDIQPRAAVMHQANRLWDVWLSDQHLIAKEFLQEADAPELEYQGLRLVEPLDIAPRPIGWHSNVVVYEFLVGEMWDRRAPSAVELAALADTWVQLQTVPTDGLWLGRGVARSRAGIEQRLRAPVDAYAEWGQHPEAAELCQQLLETAFGRAWAAVPEQTPLKFCRGDSRFTNVIGRPNGTLGMVDWEDCGLRDPARELADLLTHVHHEDLLGPPEWQPFLDRYLPSCADDRGFQTRLRGYLAIFPAFWLSLLLAEGLQRATNGTLHTWSANGLEPNLRLRRLVARCQAWPDPDIEGPLTRLEGLTFF